MTDTASAPDKALPTVGAASPSDANSSSVAIDIEAAPTTQLRRMLQQLALQRGYEDLHTSPSSDAVPQAIRENWPQISASNLKSTIYSRIIRVAFEAKKNPRSTELNASSLRTFLKFLTAVHRLNPPTPQLTLTPNGHLVAVWHKDANHYVNAMFKPDGFALYRIVNGKAVNEGRDTVEGLVSLLSRDNAWPM